MVLFTDHYGKTLWKQRCQCAGESTVRVWQSLTPWDSQKMPTQNGSYIDWFPGICHTMSFDLLVIYEIWKKSKLWELWELPSLHHFTSMFKLVQLLLQSALPTSRWARRTVSLQRCLEMSWDDKRWRKMWQLVEIKFDPQLHHLSSSFISSSTYQCLNFRRVETSQILGPTCPTCPTSLSVPSSTWVIPSSRSSPGDFQLRREPSRRHTNGSDMNFTTSRREVRKGLVRVWWERWESRSSKLVPILQSNGFSMASASRLSRLRLRFLWESLSLWAVPQLALLQIPAGHTNILNSLNRSE